MGLAFKRKLQKLLSAAVAHKSVQIAFCVVQYFNNLLKLGLQKSVKVLYK